MLCVLWICLYNKENRKCWKWEVHFSILYLCCQACPVSWITAFSWFKWTWLLGNTILVWILTWWWPNHGSCNILITPHFYYSKLILQPTSVENKLHKGWSILKWSSPQSNLTMPSLKSSCILNHQSKWPSKLSFHPTSVTTSSIHALSLTHWFVHCMLHAIHITLQHAILCPVHPPSPFFTTTHKSSHSLNHWH